MIQNANSIFTEHTCTENYYKHIFGFVYTDGVKALASRFSCYWLLDVILSYQPELKNDQYLQVWRLSVNEDNSALVRCEDGNGIVLKSQKVPFTDFDAKTCTIWVSDGVILLPSEW